MKSIFCENCEDNAKELALIHSKYEHAKSVLEMIQDVPGVREAAIEEYKDSWAGKSKLKQAFKERDEWRTEYGKAKMLLEKVYDIPGVKEKLHEME